MWDASINLFLNITWLHPPPGVSRRPSIKHSVWQQLLQLDHCRNQLCACVCAFACVCVCPSSQLWGEWEVFSTKVSSTWASSGQDQQPDQATQLILWTISPRLSIVVLSKNPPQILLHRSSVCNAQCIPQVHMRCSAVIHALGPTLPEPAPLISMQRMSYTLYKHVERALPFLRRETKSWPLTLHPLCGHLWHPNASSIFSIYGLQ